MIRPGNMARSRAWTRRFGTAVVALTVSSVALVGCTNDVTVPIDGPAQVAGNLPDEMVTQMQEAVSTAAKAYGASGAIVGVWVPWSGSWVAGIGTNGVGTERPVSTDMSFRIGAVTREMTCDVLYGMAGDGIVKVNDRLADYVAGVVSEKSPDADVTLKQLCDGMSGFAPVGDAVRASFLRTPAREWKPRELASFGLGRPAVANPGETFVGADTDYLLLGLALERAADLTAAELIAKYVTEPLALENTRLPGDKAAAPTPAPALTGLVPVNGEDGALNCAEPRDLTTLSASIGFTDSGVTSTVTDLGRYATALALGTLDPAGSKSTRFADPVPHSATAPSWYNTMGGSVLAGSLIGQTGAVPGYATAAFSDPGTGLTIVVVLNSSAGGADAARNVAFELAAMASKAPAASGQTAPDFGLPWTAEQYAEQILATATCPME